MATANFTATGRVGDGLAVVTFTDSSVGSITSRKWILGDGTVVGGNLTNVAHTYTPGTYDVILVVEDALGIDSIVREGYVVVNEVHPRPSFVIAEGRGYSNDEYWNFRLDNQLRLVYEDKNFIHRSNDSVTTVGQWTLVEFHMGPDRMFAGTYSTPRRMVPCSKFANPSPPTLTENALYVAPNSTIKIDELKVWLGEKDLNSYYYSTRAAAGLLGG